MFTKDDDRVNKALQRLSQQFRDKPNMRHLVSIFTSEAADLEEVFWDVYDTTLIDTAEGTQLDVWGEILNVSRAGQNDNIFRTRLKAAIFRYVSSGKWEEVIQGFSILVNPTYVQAAEVFPAAVTMVAVGVTNPAAISAVEIVQALRQLKPAGVRFSAVIITSDTPLVFFGDSDPTGRGLGDRLNPAVGGNFADRLSF
jgi:hypothetical protein